jgi:hypothetical protein
VNGTLPFFEFYECIDFNEILPHRGNVFIEKMTVLDYGSVGAAYCFNESKKEVWKETI